MWSEGAENHSPPLVEGGPDRLPYELGPEADGWCWGKGGPSVQVSISVGVLDTEPTSKCDHIRYFTPACCRCLIYVV